jgi:FixJ family two-component response regulator
MQVSAIEAQHIGEVDVLEKPLPNIAHEEKIHSQTEQVKNNNHHHENVIN